MRLELEGAAVSRPRRLFTKNTGPCQHEFVWMYRG